MIKNVYFNNKKAIVSYEFSEEDIMVLNHFKEHKYMEFRNGANSAIADKLLDNGFLEHDDDAWHCTIVLTKLGTDVVNAMKE